MMMTDAGFVIDAFIDFQRHGAREQNKVLQLATLFTRADKECDGGGGQLGDDESLASAATSDTFLRDLRSMCRLEIDSVTVRKIKGGGYACKRNFFSLTAEWQQK